MLAFTTKYMNFSRYYKRAFDPNIIICKNKFKIFLKNTNKYTFLMIKIMNFFQALICNFAIFAV